MKVSRLPTVSVIIPALNEHAFITRCIQSVAGEDTTEVIVVDGGSSDDTQAIARELGAKVLECEPCRARQMNAGAANAVGEVLLFLHADCTLPVGAIGRLRLRIAAANHQVGYFPLRTDAHQLAFRLIDLGSNLRARWLCRPYGDQAMFFRREAFESVGRFPDVPIMEDLLIARAARRFKPFLVMNECVTSSARRWTRDGIIRRVLRNWSVAWGEKRGVPYEQLAVHYKGPNGDQVATAAREADSTDL